MVLGDWSKLNRMSQSEIRELQSKKLVHFFKHFFSFHPFYQELFKHNNLSPGDIRGIDDLQKIPLISKEDLVPTEEVPDKPRQFILQPNKELIKKWYPKSKLIKFLLQGELEESLEREFKPIHIHFTTGRSAAQVPFLYTLYDLELLKEAGGRIFTTAGLGKDDVVVNAFPYAPHLAFWQVQKAAEAVDVRCLHTGGGKIMGTNKILNALEKMKATVLVVMPGYGYHLLKEAHQQGRDFSQLRYIIFGGERVSPGLRQKIKMLFPHVTVLATYAFTEAKTAWVQCHEESGYHLYPDLEYVELVDENGKPVPEGEPGEIVYTALDWRGSIVLRYRTGDLSEGLFYMPCKHCGRTVPQLHFDIQRKSEFKELQLSKVKGELVNLNAFYKIMHEIESIDEWQVEIRKKNDDQYEVDELHVNIACQHGERCEMCCIIVERKVQEDVGVAAQVRTYCHDVLLEKLGMERELKEKRIIDSRNR